MDKKHLAFRIGLSALSLSGASQLLDARLGGVGAILMLHHVRPYAPKPFAPHRILEITPGFLDAVLTHLATRDYDVIPLDALPERLASPGSRRFAVLTFDDGYRDNVEHALPVLRKHAAPFTVFVTTGFAEGAAPLWWLDLEDATLREAGGDPGKAGELFKRRHGELRARADLRQEIGHIAAAAGIDSESRTRALCLDWDGLRALAKEPLCSIGAHTLSHPLLGPLPEPEARAEMDWSRTQIEEKLQREVRHIAYPVGDPLAAGQREFNLARELGYATGLTTRPGVLFPEHAAHLHALPRLSVNGQYQSIRDFDVLLSGAAFALFNRGRRLNVA